MQFRHLRYFVKIVEAGSFSRASAVLYIAQPALSQQIADMESQLGLSLLHRSARGVQPTPAGEVLYREALIILRKMEQLPGIVRTGHGEIEGVVGVGMTNILAATLGGPFIQSCKAALPKVTLRFEAADSASIKTKLAANALDMAVVLEDDMDANFARQLLFRQPLYLVGFGERFSGRPKVSLEELGQTPLILPGHSNTMRRALDRALKTSGIVPNVVAEADVLTSVMYALNAGVGSAVLPKGDWESFPGSGSPSSLLIDPPIYLTATVLSSGEFPLTFAGEAARKLLMEFTAHHVRSSRTPGIEWIETKLTSQLTALPAESLAAKSSISIKTPVHKPSAPVIKIEFPKPKGKGVGGSKGPADSPAKSAAFRRSKQKPRQPKPTG